MVTRGNVAIYCYNALTAKTWDVTESTNGVLTSSKTSDTILEKYFSDFANEDGDMKLVEDAYVSLSGANTTEIGANQIKLSASYKNADDEEIGIAGFIDAESKPKKDYEEVTYKQGNDVVAYVPADVADITTLAGKEVDVIFGKDNEVAYLVVTDDAVDRAYITAWDKNEPEIELDGEAYEVREDAEVYVLGYKVNAGDKTAVEVIDEIIHEDYNFNIEKPTKTFNRTIVADIILNEDGEIKSINLIGSTNVDEVPVTVYDKETEEYVNTTLKIEEAIVKKVSNAGKITTIKNSVINNNDIDVLDENDVTVIKDGKVVLAETIEKGNVLTVIEVGDNIDKIYVSDTRVEGNVDSFKNAYSILTIDGEDYNVSNPIFSKNGDIEDPENGTFAAKEFYDVEVEAYLNFMGEISAIVGETSAVNSAFGVIASTPYYEVDKGDDPDYIGMQILTEDGKKLTYKIYNSESGDSIIDTPFDVIDGDIKYGDAVLAIGDIVTFTANDDRTIDFDFDEYEDEEFAGFALVDLNGATVAVKSEDLTIVSISNWNEENGFEYKKSGKYLTNGTKKYYFDDTVLFNIHEGKVDDVKNPSVIKWSDLVDGNDNAFANGQYLFVDEDNTIKYFAADLTGYASESSDEEYAIVLNTRPVDKDEYEITLFVDGEEIVALYDDPDAEELLEGDFVTFTLEDDETFDDILVIGNVDDIYTAKDEDPVTIDGEEVVKGNLVADRISNGAIRYEKYEDETLDPLGLCEDEEYVIYYVTKDGYEMLTDIDEVIGNYVFGFQDENCDCDAGEVNVLVVIDVIK